MPALADALTKESVHRLHQAFKDGVLELPRTEKGDIGLSQKTFNQVGIPLLRWIHYKMMRDAKPNPNKSINFPYRSEASISQVLRDEGVEFKGSDRDVRLGYDASRLLQYAGIALFYKGHWYLKPWDESAIEYVSHQHHVKVDPTVEKRIEEESDKPVKSRIDLRTFKTPDADPESVMKFIESFVPAALRVQDKYEQVHSDLQSALLRIAELETQIEEGNQAKEWEGIGSRISDLLGS